MSTVNRSLRKTDVVLVFKDLSAKATKEDDTYRAMAFANAAKEISSFGKDEIASEDLKVLSTRPHIGKGTIQRLNEWIANGLPSVDDRYPTLKLFMGIYGVGPVTAEAWYDEGYRTLQDLIDHKVHLSFGQQLGLRYYSDLCERIPRQEIELIEKQMTQLLSYVSDVHFTIAGSYRRGLSNSGDIDVIVSGKGSQEFIQLLEEYGIIEYVLSSGSTKILTIGGLASSQLLERDARSGYKRRRIDFELVSDNPSTVACALLYFTGSKDHNKKMRGIAKDKGWLLNHEGLFKDGVKFDTPTERSVFEKLGMDYLEPADR
jgi:DNA polymerase/3'-5' exonuclease PolX